MNTAVATVEPKEPKPLLVLSEQLETVSDQFRQALPAHIPLERFKRVIMTAVQNNPSLMAADRFTFWTAATKAAQDGLLPDGREGALVVFNTKMKVIEKGKEVERWVNAVQWMPMIAGIRKKVRNSGEIATWEVQVVHQMDQFEFELGDDAFIKHKPFMGSGDPGPVVAAYSVATLKSGEKSREVMTKAQIDKVRGVSKSKDGPAWRDWYEEMCRKVVARRHSKVLPMSTDLDDLMRRDDELYDFKGAKDDEAPPERPKLREFMTAPPPRISETEAAGSMPFAEQPVDKTGENSGSVAEQVEQPATAASDEPSVPDAYEAGRNARSAGTPLKAVPVEWREGHEAQASAWQEGWRERDAEMAKAKGQAVT